MCERLQIEPAEPVILLTTDIVYGYRMEFCGAQYLPLKFSLIRPRSYFPYDAPKVLPTLVFLCGGAWVEMDHNAWLPELSWFAKRGYAVVSLQYPVTAKSRFPDNLVSVKQGIRFLRAHRDELGIDTDRILLMGESAGGYLAAMCAATNDTREYDKGDCVEQSSRINAAVALYPPVSPEDVLKSQPERICDGLLGCVPPQAELPADTFRYPSVLDRISPTTAPTMLLHGMSDSLVVPSNSHRIYQALLAAGVPTELLLLDGADHADARFFQPQIKERILAFLNRWDGSMG